MERLNVPPCIGVEEDLDRLLEKADLDELIKSLQDKLEGQGSDLLDSIHIEEGDVKTYFQYVLNAAINLKNDELNKSMYFLDTNNIVHQMNRRDFCKTFGITFPFKKFHRDVRPVPNGVITTYEDDYDLHDHWEDAKYNDEVWTVAPSASSPGDYEFWLEVPFIKESRVGNLTYVLEGASMFAKEANETVARFNVFSMNSENRRVIEYLVRGEEFFLLNEVRSNKRLTDIAIQHLIGKCPKDVQIAFADELI